MYLLLAQSVRSSTLNSTKLIINPYVVLGGSSVCGCRACWRLGVHLVECACVIELPELKVCD
jgi:hypothetical protein